MSGARWDDSDDAPPAGGPAWGGGPAAGSTPPGESGGPAWGDGATREVLSGGAPYGGGDGAAGGEPTGGPAWGGAPGSSPYGAGAAPAPPGYGGGFAPPGYAVGNESLGHSLAHRPPPRRRRGPVVAGVVVGVLALGGAGAAALYAAQGLLGGGDQPEQHLPSTTVAMAKLDLNPSAGQKIDAIRFARKFPQGKGLQENGDPRQWLWEQTTKDVEGAPSWAKAQKWLGNRAAVAVLPDAKDAAKGVTVVVLAVKDDGQAAADMGSVQNAGVAAQDGWLYVSDTTAHAQAVATAAAASPLSDKPTFTADLKRLGEDGVATAWFDGAGLTTLVGNLPGQAGALTQTGRAVSGHGALALRFSGADLELAGSVADSGTTSRLVGSGTGVEKLPASTLAAVGAAGLGDALTKNWGTFAEGFGASTGVDEAQVRAQASDLLGIRVPKDLSVLLGSRTALAVGGPTPAFGLPTIGVRVETDAAKARPLVRRLTSGLDGGDLPIGLESKTFADGYALADDADFAAALAASDGGLGASPTFTAAVPDAAKASVVAYADVSGLVAAYGDQLSASDREGLAALKSFGLTVVTDAGGTSTLRMRLTTK